MNNIYILLCKWFRQLLNKQKFGKNEMYHAKTKLNRSICFLYSCLQFSKFTINTLECKFCHNSECKTNAARWEEADLKSIWSLWCLETVWKLHRDTKREDGVTNPKIRATTVEDWRGWTYCRTLYEEAAVGASGDPGCLFSWACGSNRFLSSSSSSSSSGIVQAQAGKYLKGKYGIIKMEAEATWRNYPPFSVQYA